MAWERVHTVHNYYDGPLEGVADFEGQPHWYSREFDEAADEYSDRYWLTKIEPDLLRLIMEEWEIWQRWHAEFKEGRVGVTLQEPMALPDDQQRASELKQAIGDRPRVKTERSFRRRGEFGTAGVTWSEAS